MISCGDWSFTRAFTVRDKRTTPDGLRLLFTAQCVDPSGVASIYGYAVFREFPLVGLQAARSSWARVVRPSRHAFVDFGIGLSISDGTGEITLFGQVRDPRVVALEATFVDDTTKREPVANGLFVIIAHGMDTAGELRVLDAHAQILERIPLPAMPMRSSS